MRRAQGGFWKALNLWEFFAVASAASARRVEASGRERSLCYAIGPNRNPTPQSWCAAGEKWWLRPDLNRGPHWQGNFKSFAAAELANGPLIQPFNLSVNEPASWIQVTKHKPEPGSAVFLFTEWLQQEIDSDPNFKAAR